ncbi:MAG TPA: hypothetical protein VMW39_05110 [bacterium]|nr:hypothetical protein [bacterium]
MKTRITLSIVVSLASLVLGIITRLIPGTLVVAPRTFLFFAGYCLVLAIALELYPSKKE